MNSKKMKQLIYDKNQDNVIGIIVKDIKNQKKAKRKQTIDYLIGEMNTTHNAIARNRIACILSEMKCQKAVRYLIPLIFRPELRNNRGTLIYALENLDCKEYLFLLIPLLFQEDNYEVRMEMYSLLKSCEPYISIETRNYCLYYIKERMEILEDILENANDIYENLLKSDHSDDLS